MPTLVARRPFTWHGNRVEANDVLSPQPDDQKAKVLLRNQFVVESNSVAGLVQRVVPDGLVCPTCGKVLRTPVGLKTHHTRVHGHQLEGA